MKTKLNQWHKPPARGCKKPMAELYRFTTIRLSDKHERFTDRLPAARLRRSPDYMVWDNLNNSEWID